MDRTGKELVPPRYDGLADLGNGTFAFNLGGAMVGENFRGGAWSFLNAEGQELASPQYEDLGQDSEGFWQVKKNGLWGFADETGQERVAPQFEIVEGFSEGMAPVFRDKK